MGKEKLTLSNMCNGGVQEKIDRCLMEISNNILDPNTDAKKKRSMVVTISFLPNEHDREDVAVEVSTAVKLAPEMNIATQLFISKDLRAGTVNLVEHEKGQIKGQLTLDDMGMSTDPADLPTENATNGSDVIDMKKAMNQ